MLYIHQLLLEIFLESTEEATEPTSATGIQITGEGEGNKATGRMGDGESESTRDDGEGVQGSMISVALGAVGATVGLLLLITAVLTVLFCVWRCSKRYSTRGIFSTII